MPTKTLTQPFKWKRGFDNNIDTYTGPDGELTLDLRPAGTPNLRIHDGTTPGGQPQIATPAVGIATPVIQYPLNNAVDVKPNAIIIASTIITVVEDAKGYVHGVYASTDWQIATDAGFTTIVAESLADNTHVSAYPMDLALSTGYYCRVRYNDAAGQTSAWSDTVSFTTAATLFSHNTSIINTGYANYSLSGSSVAVSNDGGIVAIGAPNVQVGGVNGAGEVRIYIRDIAGVYTLDEIVDNPTPVGEKFGSSVSISGDGQTLIIGAPFKMTSYVTDGAVYVYKHDGIGYALDATLLASDAFTHYNHGASVALSDDASLLFVGAPGREVSGVTDAGGVYLYKIDGTGNYIENTILAASDYAAGNLYGSSIAISSDNAVLAIGSNGVTVSAQANAGAIYVYDNNGSDVFIERGILTRPAPVANAPYGYALALADLGNTLYIGDPSQVKSAVVTGGVLTLKYSASTFTAGETFLPNAGLASDAYGASVALSSDGAVLAMGGYGVDSTGIDIGAVDILI